VAVTVDSVRLIRFWQHDSGGVLTVFPGGEDGVPFPVRRIFSITGVPAGGRRANHAHRRCTQLHACVAGRVDIHLNDGTRSRDMELAADGMGLMVPPLLWSSLVFEHPGTALIVICDELYDEADYIRDWQEFLLLKRAEAE